VPELHWVITLLSHRNATLRVSLRRTYRILPTTRLRGVNSTNTSSVGSRSMVWRRTMTMCWRKKTPLCFSQASKTAMASRSWWLSCQMIWHSGSGNYRLSRIRNRITFTNALSNIGVETSSKASDGWCGSDHRQSILFTPLSVAFTAIHHRNASVLKCTLRTGCGRSRWVEILQDNNVLMGRLGNTQSGGCTGSCVLHVRHNTSLEFCWRPDRVACIYD